MIRGLQVTVLIKEGKIRSFEKVRFVTKKIEISSEMDERDLLCHYKRLLLLHFYAGLRLSMKSGVPVLVTSLAVFDIQFFHF